MNPWSFALFLAAVLLILGGIHLFLYKQVVGGLGVHALAALWSLRLAFALLAVSYPLARWLDGFAPDGIVLAAHWIASVWIGLMFHLLWTLGLLALLRLVLRIAGPPGAEHEAVCRWSFVVGVAVAVILCVAGMIGARRSARVRHVAVPVAATGNTLRDLKIAVVADLHAGVLMDAAEVRRRVAEIERLEPDLVLIPGDILDHPPRRLARVGAALAALDPPLGVVASTGNHEYIVGVEASLAFLRAHGVRVLVDECIELPGGLVVAGAADASAPRFGGKVLPVREVLGEDARARPVVLLSHTPGVASVRAGAEAGADLQLSGHTHGGQIWPFSFLTRLAGPYHHGLYAVGDGYQLTTCGVGWWGPPMRLGAPPEIVLVRLVGRGETARIDGVPIG